MYQRFCKTPTSLASPFHAPSVLGFGFNFSSFTRNKCCLVLSLSGAAQVDIALKKTAYSSSVGWGGTPEKANDGNPSTYSHTLSNRNDSYLVIDLEEAYLVHKVIIKERAYGPRK